MASAPYRIIDRRGTSSYSASNNSLIKAASQSDAREATPSLDFDVHHLVSSLGRRTLMNLGRAMFWRFPALHGAILEQANISVSTFIPQYTGRNKEWGRVAELVLADWHQIIDVAGWPYDFDSYLAGLVIAPQVEGEQFTLLCKTPEGYPMIQVIPAHRVGSKSTGACMAKVRFEGSSLWIDGKEIDNSRPYSAATPVEFEARVVDGVIVDDYSRPIAYRVYQDNWASGEFQDIPARNMFPSFMPLVTGQVRGFSLLASSILSWNDIAEWREFEMLAQKAFASKTIVETNESGEADTAKNIIKGKATFDAAGGKTSLDVQKLSGGIYHYLKAGSGSKLEPFNYNRPGNGSATFMDTTLRDAFRGTEWDYFFSLDPSRLGGATMRVVVDKINMVAGKRRKLARKACRRVDGFGLSVFMQLGLLPWDDDWYKWEYQGPGDVTADKKYDSDVDLQEISQGIGTRRRACARRGLYLEDVDAQREREADSDLTRASRLAAKHGITIQEALIVLRPPSQSAQLPSTAAASPEAKKEGDGNTDGKPAPQPDNE